jgi:hypothetical protein
MATEDDEGDMLEAFLGNDTTIHLTSIHAKLGMTVTIFMLIQKHAEEHPERMQDFVRRACQQLDREQIKDDGMITDTRRAAQLLLLLATCPSAYVYRQLVLDRIHLLVRTHANAGLIRQLMSVPNKVPLSDRTLHEEDVQSTTLLLDHTPLPRDVVLMCVAYARTSRMKSHILAEAVRSLCAGRIFLPSLAIEMLTPNTIAPVSCMTIALGKLAADGNITSDMLARSASLFTALATAIPYVSDNQDYWRAWIACGLLDAMHYSSIWKSIADKFRITAIHVMRLLVVMTPIGDPSVTSTCNACMLDVIEYTSASIDVFDAGTLESNTCVFLRHVLLDSTAGLDYDRALLLITNHRLLDLIRLYLESCIVEVQQTACDILLRLATLEDGRMRDMLCFLLSLRPRGHRTKSTCEFLLSLPTTPQELCNLLLSGGPDSSQRK